MIIGIDHINIVVSNIEITEAFFELFGFKKVNSGILQGKEFSEIVGLYDAYGEYSVMSMPNEEVNIELMKYSAPVFVEYNKNSIPNTIGFRHIAFKVKKLDSEYIRLKNSDVEFQSKPVKVGNKKVVYFYGPDSIILELAEYS